ncbi:hypothetical protein SEHO0A_02486 [Salmonella enterica subsp. houtenae str. ATCC BAA-1581]|nr:hypothetical protein SEHO0A_02486 [Salmonella enterica subsp. houtenae str. ATCC BAA-1581]ENZ86156.1 hypothetical protein D088_950085 [Salmonella enterica subsp. houtenae serovar 16:z4,z32:-- str. RKS3027]
MPLTEKYAKWHRLKGISSIMPKKTPAHDVNHKCQGYHALRSMAH